MRDTLEPAMKDTRNKRRGDTGDIPFRSGRIFSVGSEWYFTTREGDDVGPFETKQEAEAALAVFLRNYATDDQQLKG